MQQQKCTLCPAAAQFYCVNDDASLCASCDAAVHSGNPLLARHERRALTAGCDAECASAAHTSHSDDVAVVPQFGAVAPSSPTATTAAEDDLLPPAAALLAGPSPAPASAAAFDGPASDFGADLLSDLDLPLLNFDFKELEAANAMQEQDQRSDFGDCVVPSALNTTTAAPSPFTAAASTASAYANFPPVPASLAMLHPGGSTHTHTVAPAPLLHSGPSSANTMVPVSQAPALNYSGLASGFHSSHSGFGSASSYSVPSSFSSGASGYSAVAYPTNSMAYPTYAAPAAHMVPQPQPHTQQATHAHQRRHAAYTPVAHRPSAHSAEDDEAREERLRRYRQQKRAKRNLGRTVRYQSRKAYAMIRPRIKGRFVSPEEWEAHLASTNGQSTPQSPSDHEVSEAIVPAVY